MKKWMLDAKLTYKQWVMLAVGVSCLLGVLVYLSLSSVETAAKDTNQVELVKVVVAKQDIPERTIIKDNMLKVVEMPVDVVPAEAVHDVSEITGNPTSVAIQQGDIMTTKKIFADVRMAGFTGTIPANCRAVSVAITDITGVSGFAKPGDFVDVMVVSGTKEAGFKGEILLQNVQLLAINKTGSQGAEENKDNKSSDNKNGEEGAIKGSSDAMATATLALPLDEALKVATASQKGTIYLVLRPVAPTDIFTINTDYMIPAERGVNPAPQNSAPAASAPAPTPAPAAAAAPAPAVQPASASAHENGGMKIIRGTRSTGGN
ncbi:Flp pilus assembly protein CpaB [Selenomonas ruminantium]|uniref:Pilus assembly protein CpaB n=1 Tax=Selenomonas ruminantium TaxID=971 RepID=A0A1H0MET9_SELRU|nr:Flp pilus assembly protein CpaB [Selenomonas ruminantium]SDO78700.1 pilus assembly protein CpaB [Selenomonas ruminantium]